MISLNSISCKFQSKTILKDISLEIRGHLSILGANGSGKSTLAKVISSLVDYDGEVLIDSKNIKEFSLLERAKTISYIPAKLESYDSFITLEEFVLLGRFPYKKSFFDYLQKDRDIVLKTLKLLNIEHLKKHSIGSLSSGEGQLALIATALVQESKIIIFDEPTANLDPQNSKIVAQHIKSLKKNHQVILITHDLHLASYIDTPVLFIRESKADYFEEDFFKDEMLYKLYGVEFNSLVLKYD